jgi:thiol:disulfide interchange protein
MILVLAASVAGWRLVSPDQAARQQTDLAELEQANRQLTDRLFSLQAAGRQPAGTLDLPYDEGADARAAVDAARTEAVEQGRFLMVTFGANWCMDCRTLYRNLNNEEVADYARDRFLFVNVNVGKFNRNRQLADELGVDLSRGIPVAIFFNPDGRVIGATNEGQLEPARRYSSKQILRFLRDIAERERLLAPDSVGI